jgi:hypothetical protein
MNRQVISMSEIMRVAPWSLRALGLPFGVAERATRQVTWTEAAIGGALSLLRVGEAALRASIIAPAAMRQADRYAGRVIAANGRNLLELGGAAADLATAQARLHERGHVVIRDSIATLLVPSLADLLLKRGLDAIVGYSAGGADIAIDAWPKSGWIAVTRRAGFVRGEINALVKIAHRVSGATAAFLHAQSGELAEASSKGRGHIFIAATTGELPAVDDHGRVEDYAERVARAYRDGLEVVTADLKHLYDLERITWAPTSERSRKQAGY